MHIFLPQSVLKFVDVKGERVTPKSSQDIAIILKSEFIDNDGPFDSPWIHSPFYIGEIFEAPSEHLEIDPDTIEDEAVKTALKQQKQLLETFDFSKQAYAAVKRFTEAYNLKDYESVVFSVERPYRVNNLLYVHALLRNGTLERSDALNTLIVDTYKDSEAPNLHNSEVWKTLFEDFLGDQECLIFDEEDKPLYDACGGEITVYRGCRQDEIDGFESDAEGLGISWTTRKETALWFANRFETMTTNQAKLNVLTATLSKADAYFFSDSRSEAEFCVDPAKLRNIQPAY